MLRRPRPAWIAAALALAVGAAGCGGREGGGGETDGGGSGETVTVDAAEGVEVTGSEYFFDPETVVAEGGGSLEITFVNDGSIAHNLTVFNDDSEVAATETFPGGEEETVTADLEPGTYRMVCTVANHEELGMVGEIEVRGR